MRFFPRPMILLTALPLAGACQSSGVSRGPGTGAIPASSVSSAPTSPDEIVESAPAATRLQDIGGYLLLYYRENQQMPPSLDELRNIPGGADLDFTSPSTGQPFVYDPAGFWALSQSDKYIVAYDPGPTRKGKRWCLFMTVPKAGTALSVDVVAVPEQIFLNYQRTGQ